MSNYCEACYPQKIKGHKIHWTFELLTAPWLFKRKKKLKTMRTWTPIVPYWLNALHFVGKIFAFLGLIKFKADIDRTAYNNRSLAVFDAARAAGIRVEGIISLGRTSQQMRAFIGNKVFYYFSVPFSRTCLDIDDKGILMGYLERLGAPVPNGKIFWTRRGGLKYGRELGFPVVVKPVHGSRSAHAVYPIKNEEELSAGIDIALQYEPRYYVQKYIPGFLHRFTVVNGEYVFCAKRLPPHVIGDGISSIAHLIDEKNKDPRRAAPDAKNATLHIIPKNDVTEEYLGRSGMGLTTIPARGETVQLAPKISIGSGGDVIEVTPKVHQDNTALFQKIGKSLKVDIVGFDVMCPNVAVSWKDGGFAIIEGNGLPFLDFHHFPGEGTPQPAADKLWESILSKIVKKN